MTKLFKPVISLWRTWKKTKNLGAAYRLLPEVYSPDTDAAALSIGLDTEWPSYGKKLSRNQLDLFGKHGELLLKFLKSGSVGFETKNGTDEILNIRCHENNIRFAVSNYDNLKVAEEIFIDRLYDFQSPDTYVVCDVGMNVAASVLYFASAGNVKKVYGYEPFLQTYNRALQNIGLNEELAQKIETYPFGLGDKNEWVNVPLPSDDFLGGSTTSDFIEQLPEELKTSSVKVELRSFCEELRRIRKNHPQEKILLKLDCEGAEYAIMNQMEKENLIGEISVWMIEFHFRGKKELAEKLLRNNFFILSPVSDEVNRFGMLYAVKNN
jgi:FkbM family methyltransferase